VSSSDINKNRKENKNINSFRLVHYLSQTSNVAQKARKNSYKSVAVSIEDIEEKSRRSYVLKIPHIESPEIEVIELDTESLQIEKLYTKHEQRELLLEIARKIISFFWRASIEQ